MSPVDLQVDKRGSDKTAVKACIIDPGLKGGPLHDINNDSVFSYH